MENRDCVFCQIVAGEIPADVVLRDEQVTAFVDIAPIAPVHVLVVPNRHIDSMNEVTEDDQELLGHLFLVARNLAQKCEVDIDGYRLMVNTGENGRQTVFHLHVHLIGGKRLMGRLINTG